MRPRQVSASWILIRSNWKNTGSKCQNVMFFRKVSLCSVFCVFRGDWNSYIANSEKENRFYLSSRIYLFSAVQLLHIFVSSYGFERRGYAGEQAQFVWRIIPIQSGQCLLLIAEFVETHHRGVQLNSGKTLTDIATLCLRFMSKEAMLCSSDTDVAPSSLNLLLGTCLNYEMCHTRAPFHVALKMS